MCILKGLSHRLVQTPSIGTSGCNSVESGGAGLASISQHNPQQIPGLKPDENFDAIGVWAACTLPCGKLQPAPASGDVWTVWRQDNGIQKCFNLAHNSISDPCGLTACEICSLNKYILTYIYISLCFACRLWRWQCRRPWKMCVTYS